jgi:pimeloyl-ACP methyl ester carboxylesterase
MGGTVSLSVAIQFPHRVSKVVVVGSPIVGSSLAPPLKLAGYRFVAFMLFNMMWAFRGGIKVAAPFICADPQFPQMMDRDLSSTTLESFLRSIASLRRTDLRPLLSQIQIPTMGIYGGRDNIVHPNQWQPLLQGIPKAKIVFWQRAQHFVMLDMSKEFTETLKIFLDEEEKKEG